MTVRICFPALGAVLAVLAVACTEGPTGSTPDAQDPSLATATGGKPSGDPPIVITFRDGAGDNIRSDGRGPSGGSYEDGVCGVQATFNGTDARLKPDFRTISPKEATACGGRQPRSVKVTLDGTTYDGGFFKVNEVELVTEADGTVLRTAKVVAGAGCGDLRFNPGLGPNSDFLLVTKNADGTWTVATQPAPNDVAVCLVNLEPRAYYHLPFAATVRLK